MFKEETMPVLQKLSIINEEETLPKLLCGANITLIQKPDRGITRKDYNIPHQYSSKYSSQNCSKLNLAIQKKDNTIMTSWVLCQE